MITANLYSVCENVEDKKGYSVLLSIVSLNKDSNKSLKDIDALLNFLYGKESEFYKSSKRHIIKVNSLNFCIDYYIPCDIGLIMGILELFTYRKDSDAFLGTDFIMKEQLFRKNQRELYFQVSEFVKMGIIELREEKKKEQLSLVKII